MVSVFTDYTAGADVNQPFLGLEQHPTFGTHYIVRFHRARRVEIVYRDIALKILREMTARFAVAPLGHRYFRIFTLPPGGSAAYRPGRARRNIGDAAGLANTR